MNKIIYFFLSDRNFTLELWPNRDVFSRNSQFLVHTDNGVISSSYDPSTFYKGKIVGKELKFFLQYIVSTIVLLCVT